MRIGRGQGTREQTDVEFMSMTVGHWTLTAAAGASVSPTLAPLYPPARRSQSREAPRLQAQTVKQPPPPKISKPNEAKRCTCATAPSTSPPVFSTSCSSPPAARPSSAALAPDLYRGGGRGNGEPPSGAAGPPQARARLRARGPLRHLHHFLRRRHRPDQQVSSPLVP